MHEEQWDRVGECVEQLMNLLGAMQLPLPDAVHMEALRAALPQIKDKLRKAYAEATGEDPFLEY